MFYICALAPPACSAGVKDWCANAFSLIKSELKARNTGRVFRGLYGETTLQHLKDLERLSTTKVKLFTRLDQPPAVGLPLNVSADTSELSNAIQVVHGSRRNLYEAEIPGAVLDELFHSGLAWEAKTSMGRVVGKEFSPAVSEYMAPKFHFVSGGH